MYGTIARMRLKPGVEPELERLSREDIPAIPGLVFQYVYRTDADPREVFLVVAFEGKEVYVANAASPEQQARYRRYRDLLEGEPSWHDGEIIFSSPA